ncbi:hypothetical protein [Treponema primitia]|uniref:hypothetical protein n=1 Tax=Treponema primitia TaxID=88058 RepID=UPI0005A00292|nr:hypothetical protein [Treponema primitia]
MEYISPERRRINAEKSLALASTLFSGEEWVQKEPHIWVAKSRIAASSRESAKLAWEIDQVRILTSRGSAVYFLPEQEDADALGVLSADTIIDGQIVELKAVSGTRQTLGFEFKKGYKQGAALTRRCPDVQGHSVFIRLFSHLSTGSVKAKIAGELKNRLDPGFFICYFETTGELYTWAYEELRALIGT